MIPDEGSVYIKTTPEDSTEASRKQEFKMERVTIDAPRSISPNTPSTSAAAPPGSARPPHKRFSNWRRRAALRRHG